MSKGIVLTGEQFWRIKAALHAKELFEIKARQLEQQVQENLTSAFVAAGLDPTKTYDLNQQTREVREIEAPRA